MFKIGDVVRLKPEYVADSNWIQDSVCVVKYAPQNQGPRALVEVVPKYKKKFFRRSLGGRTSMQTQVSTLVPAEETAAQFVSRTLLGLGL